MVLCYHDGQYVHTHFMHDYKGNMFIEYEDVSKLGWLDSCNSVGKLVGLYPYILHFNLDRMSSSVVSLCTWVINSWLSYKHEIYDEMSNIWLWGIRSDPLMHLNTMFLCNEVWVCGV